MTLYNSPTLCTALDQYTKDTELEMHNCSLILSVFTHLLPSCVTNGVYYKTSPQRWLSTNEGVKRTLAIRGGSRIQQRGCSPLTHPSESATCYSYIMLVFLQYGNKKYNLREARIRFGLAAFQDFSKRKTNARKLNGYSTVDKVATIRHFPCIDRKCYR